MKSLLRSVFGLLAAAIGLSVIESGDAGQVVWSSERMARNLDSSGRELTDGFRFELGGFVEGFRPDTENVADWASHWIGIGHADYSTATGFFAASTVISESGRDVRGPAYVWGYNSKSTGPGAEWILVTNRSWILPSGGSEIAPPRQWSMGTATEIIVGSVNASPGVHMQTSAVAVGAAENTHTVWLANHGLSRVDESQVWELDSDLDGVSNLSEYAAGTDPMDSKSVSRGTVHFHTGQEGRAITLTFDKNPEARVHYQVELSSDLDHWEPGNEQIELVSDDATQLIFRDLVPFQSSEPRFYRLNVALIP